ncbi:TRL domain-containing protein [Desulfococcaceae bacterium HSG8]|nr:TRL domain-containing protein [Desulfococcaceae bacterium HSG8]
MRIKTACIGMIRLVSLFLLLFFLSACSGANVAKFGSNSLSGIVYNHTTIPLTTDINNTPVIDTPAKGKVVQVKEPISGYGLYAEWDSNAIGDIARKHGLKRIYYADIETFSILGIWTKKEVRIYGE